MSWPAEPVTIRVPATSANLGPGFDSLGLALGLQDTVRARLVAGDTEVETFWMRPAEARPGAEQNLIIRAMTAGFAAFGEQPPGIAVSCTCAIPQGFGLGSSAAAIVAGLLAARELTGRRGVAVPAAADLLQLASELEGHPDNVAACLFGGLTIAWTADGTVRAVRLDPLPQIAPVLCVPTVPLPTHAARMVLPAQVPHADAAANSARTALLIAALTSQPELLLAATEDFLHQRYRAEAMPASAALIGLLRAAGLAAVVSGAGPAVLVLTVAGQRPGAAEVAELAADTGVDWNVLPLSVDADGAAVLAAGS